MRFAHPLILWLMIATLPALVAFLVWARRRRTALISLFIQTRLQNILISRTSPRQDILRLCLLTLATATLFLTLARPQWGYTWQEARQRGLDIIVAIDTSRSMLATDTRPSRLERARLAALDLLQLARSDRLGLVAFAGTAYLQCPLTLDEDAFRQTVQALDTSIIPQGGTALAAAIDTALAAFKDENNFKILVLLTDGEDHDSNALEAAQRAEQAGMKIFTLGVGTPAGEILQVQDEQGAPSYIKDSLGNAVKSQLNEGLLQQIATTSGGFYLPLRSTTAIQTLYDQGLAPIPKSELSARIVREYHERYPWPLALAILLLLAEALLPYPRDRRPRTATTPAAPATATLALLALALGTTHLHASSRSALRDYQEGRFEESATEYQRLLQAKPEDPKLQFNAATADYRVGNLEAAARTLTNVLRSTDLTLQQKAFYNLGNTLYRLGENQQDPNAKRNAWESALQSFQAARTLNTNDLDAAHNHELVRLKLEELKQQQQQQQQKDQQNKDDPKQDQKDPQQDDQQKDQKEQQKDQKQQPDSSKQDQDSSEKSKEQPQPKPDQPQDQNQKPQDQPGSQPQPNPDDPNQEQTAASAGRMTPDQARNLLDTQKSEERALLFTPLQTNSNPGRVLKDW